MSQCKLVVAVSQRIGQQFGPAYKGIPLNVATDIAYSRLYNKEIRYCSNRMEAKDHGADKGLLLGSDIKKGDRIVIVEDVTTSGTSIDETIPVIYSQDLCLQPKPLRMPVPCMPTSACCAVLVAMSL